MYFRTVSSLVCFYIVCNKCLRNNPIRNCKKVKVTEALRNKDSRILQVYGWYIFGSNEQQIFVKTSFQILFALLKKLKLR